ncbi:MAG: adenylate/guanylate cyclase domain-containing protein, partial [Runella zeae]
MTWFRGSSLPPTHTHTHTHTHTFHHSLTATQKFQWDLWGDTVTHASLMESTSSPMLVQLSESSHRLVYDKYVFQERHVMPNGVPSHPPSSTMPLPAYLLVGRRHPSLPSLFVASSSSSS